MDNGEKTESKKMEKFSILEKYLHDIKNMNPLKKEMLNHINDMSHEDKMKIIIALNRVVDTLSKFVSEYM